MAEIQLAVKRDQEEDRQAGTGINRVLNLFGPIGGDSLDTYVVSLDHWARKGNEPITININSPGGSVIDGYALFDTIVRLRRGGIHVTTHAKGMAASMGAILMQSGDERVMDVNASMLIHEINASNVSGKISLIDDETTFFKTLNNRSLKILAERSTLTPQQITTKSKRKEWWLDSETALKFGFVDRIDG